MATFGVVVVGAETPSAIAEGVAGTGSSVEAELPTAEREGLRAGT